MPWLMLTATTAHMYQGQTGRHGTATVLRRKKQSLKKLIPSIAQFVVDNFAHCRVKSTNGIPN